MTLPSYSVVIPTFRRPEKLKRALNSVLNQKYTNFDILVVDDDNESSGDDLKSIVNSFNSSKIRLIKNGRSKGANGARNTGILNSQNEYVALLDDDDEWTGEHLSQISNYIIFNHMKTQITLSAHTLVDNISYKSVLHKEEYLTLERYLKTHITVNTGSTFCAKKSLIDQECLFDEKMKRNQDVDFIIRVLQKQCVKLLREPTVIIYGHSTCSLPVLVESKIHLFKKLETSCIEKNLINRFKSRGYCELAIYALRNKNFKLAAGFIFTANRHRLVGPVYYMKYFVILLDEYLNLDLERRLKEK